MKNLRILLGFFALSLLALVVTGVVLSYIGVEHGPLLVKVGSIFLAVNIVLYLLLLIVSVIRNLINLYIEKKQKVIGSKFRTRLVFAFVGLTLIPSILLFILSNQLINNSLDKWFSLEIQKPLDDSMNIAKAFYYEEMKKAKEYADFLSFHASRSDINRSINRAANPDTSRGESNLKVFFLKNPDQSDFIRNAFNGTSDTEIVTTKDGDIIRAASPVREGGKISGVVVVETVIEKETVNQLESIKNAYNEYHQIKIHQNPIKLLYFFILTVATLVIIFLALWIAMRIAKGITIPIRSLAEATNAIAQGNLDYRIDLEREDEIGLLINSFNKMVGELREGKLTLEKAYTEMEAILENINTGVILLERSGRIASLNNAACSMLNLNRDNIIGKSHREILGRIKSEDLDMMLKKLEQKDFKFTEGEIHAYIDSKPVNFRIYITVLKNSKGNFIGILVVFENLTEIITAQRAIAWQEVAKRIAHEIKNPLTPIQLSTERLIKKWDEKAADFEEVLKRSTTTIVNEVNSLRNLVNEFSRFGKMPKINLQPTNMKLIIEEALNLYKDMRQLHIITSFQETPEIEADQEQLKRAIINLIDNAIQAKTERIWLNTSYDPSLEVVRIEVVDEGEGIKEEERNRLFLPYFSTKKDGTGLGLAIVSTIISKHRGYIRVKNNEPRGTRFIIELPVG